MKFQVILVFVNLCMKVLLSGKQKRLNFFCNMISYQKCMGMPQICLHFCTLWDFVCYADCESGINIEWPLRFVYTRNMRYGDLVKIWWPGTRTQMYSWKEIQNFHYICLKWALKQLYRNIFPLICYFWWIFGIFVNVYSFIYWSKGNLNLWGRF